MILAIDVGYGHVKYAYGGEMGKFPTIIAPISIFGGEYGKNNTYAYNGKHYLVGENATYENNAVIPTRTEDFLIKYSPLCIYHTFKKIDIKEVEKVVLSLSLVEYAKKKDILKQSCSNFLIDGSDYKNNIIVYPQGLGIWANIGMPDNAIIIDIGFNTVDIVTFLDKTPRVEHSFGLSDMGVCNITDAISEYINKKFDGMYLNQHDANEILYKNGIFNIMRKKYDISDFISEQKEMYAENIMSVILSNSKLKNILSKIDMYVIAGGGAYFIPEYVVKKYSLTIPQQPEFANVSGFLKVASDKID